jgi:hypothetical protein
MGGGLLQLVAYGAQDAYLSGNPQITFWRGLYKRHTNFAMEPFRVNLTGQANWGVKHSAILPRHADLIFNAYLEVELPSDGTLVYDGNNARGTGAQSLYNLIEYVELDIGGQVIDRLYGEWLYLWSQLTYNADQDKKLDSLFGGQSASDSCGLTGRPSRGGATNSNGFVKAGTGMTYIPLAFWFARNPGAALPLIALQYHEVKINILWNKTKLIYSDGGEGSSPLVPTTKPAGPKQANLLIDYVYLDVEERRRMAQESHEYLIEQTQYNEDKGISSASNRIDLTFNHPVKELVWVTQASARRDCRVNGAPITPLDYDDIIYDCSIQINGQDRVPSLPRQYYTTVQPYQHHSGTTLAGVHAYSFAIRPEEHQPSGTCNFSRIDTAHIVFTVDGDVPIGLDSTTTIGETTYYSNYDVRVYAINYNVLRIMSGMAGLAYSN